jgi:hypothetical protein
MVGLVWFTARLTWICASLSPSRLILAAWTECATGPVAKIGSLQLSADWCLLWRRYALFYKATELRVPGFKTWLEEHRMTAWLQCSQAVKQATNTAITRLADAMSLNIAALDKVWPLPGSPRNGQASLYLCQKTFDLLVVYSLLPPMWMSL